jgi:hypothetical protein
VVGRYLFAQTIESAVVVAGSFFYLLIIMEFYRHVLSLQQPCNTLNALGQSMRVFDIAVIRSSNREMKKLKKDKKKRGQLIATWP